MNEMFKELEQLGINLKEEIHLYNKPENKKNKPVVKPKIVKEVVYQRKMECPVCDSVFMTSSVRASRIRFIDTELDLRPLYEGFDPIPYDVVSCPMCGYAHLNKYFKNITDIKKDKIKDKISINFIGKDYSLEYTYEDAIERYKLALFNCIVGLDSVGIKAYLALKISWLYRGYIEKLEEDSSDNHALKRELKKMEKQFSQNAYDGFAIAYENETFPIAGIERNNIEYLIAELARRNSEFAEAKKWLSRVIVRQNSKRLNNKIFEVKELIMKSVDY